MDACVFVLMGGVVEVEVEVEEEEKGRDDLLDGGLLCVRAVVKGEGEEEEEEGLCGKWRSFGRRRWRCRSIFICGRDCALLCVCVFMYVCESMCLSNHQPHFASLSLRSAPLSHVMSPLFLLYILPEKGPHKKQKQA